MIHRDVKPSNLLLDARGTVWVTDFGLAHDAVDTHSLTGTGDLLGTLPYLPPERLSGRGDARSDVYSLGATLHEIACGRPIRGAADRAVLLHQILHQDPLAPRVVCPSLPRDLETIILKATARDPAHRYATAGAMAEDLRRFLDDRPILARRTPVWQRAARWCRRNRAVAALLALLAVTITGGFMGMTVLWREASRRAASESRLRIEFQAIAADRDLEQAAEGERGGDAGLAMLWTAEALKQAPPERPDLLRFAGTELVGIRRRTPRRLAVFPHREAVWHASFSGDGRTLMTQPEENQVYLWDLTSGKQLATIPQPMPAECIAISPDGRLAATGCRDGFVRVWDTSSRRTASAQFRLEQSVRLEHRGPSRLLFSPDGRYLAARDYYQGTWLWELATGHRVDFPSSVDPRSLANLPPDQLRRLLHLELGLGHVPYFDNRIPISIFTPDGKCLLVHDLLPERLRIVEIFSKRLVGPSIPCPGLRWWSFSPDGRRIGLAREPGSIEVWDVATERLVHSIPTEVGADLNRAVFSPDGRRLLLFLGELAVRIWDLEEGRALGGTLRHEKKIQSAAFSPDGRLVVTVSDDRTARLWNAHTGLPLGTPLRHEDAVWSTAFSPDGRLLVTCCINDSRTAHLWDLSRMEQVVPVKSTIEEFPRDLRTAFDRAGTTTLIGGHRHARLVDTGTGEPIGAPIVVSGTTDTGAGQVELSPDGRRLAVASRQDCLVLLDDARPGERRSRSTQAARRRILRHTGRVTWLTFSPDGRILATAEDTGDIHLWDAESGRQVDGPIPFGGCASTLAFSPEGRHLVAGTPPKGLTHFDLHTRELQRHRPTTEQRWELLVVRPGRGDFAAASPENSFALVFSTASRQFSHEFRAGPRLRGITYSPDGNFLLTTSEGESWQLWDASTGAPIIHAPVPKGDPSTPGVFSPDGRTIAVGFADGSVRLWDVATSAPLGQAGTLPNQCRALAIRADGESIAVVDVGGNVAVLPLPSPITGPTDRVIQEAQLQAGMDLSNGKTPVRLNEDAWYRLSVERLAAPDAQAVSDPEDWHARSARDAEARRIGFAARWHLDRLIASHPGDGLLHARRARARLWEGDVTAARADMERALTLGPRQSLIDWFHHAAWDAAEEGRREVGLPLVDLVVDEDRDELVAVALQARLAGGHRPGLIREEQIRDVEQAQDSCLLSLFAHTLFELGRWPDVTRLFNRATEIGTVPFQQWWQAAVAFLEQGDLEGYRRLCDQLRTHYPRISPEGIMNDLFTAITLLAPGGLGDGTPTSRWGEALDDSGRVAYRAGRYREAIELLQKQIGRDGDSNDPVRSTYLALALMRIGQADRARAILARAVRDEPRRQGEFWLWTGGGLRLLLREAEQLILGPDLPADPFAP